MVRPQIHRLGTIALLLAVCCCMASRGAARADDVRRNVLLIIADDLRPELGCYGLPDVQTPHIDRLASQGLLFRRAYCQIALCNPSRSSLLTGLRPDSIGVFDNGAHFRDARPEAVTLPQYFKQHGYHVQGLGKIFHPGCEDPPSWSVPHWDPSQSSYGPAGLAVQQALQDEFERTGQSPTNHPRIILGPAWEETDADDDELADGETAARAVEVLRELSARPFFLTVGFLRPHLPLVAPRRYWELYPPEQVVLPENYFPPRDVPECALHQWTELRFYAGMPKTGPLSDAQAREVIRGYRAATSYLDAQVGRLLDELERLELRESTVVVLLGDHGWQLGEHGLWCKHTNFEVATRSPLIISVPSQRTAGRSTDALVEFVDLYPTLVELCGLPPAGDIDGASFASLLQQPDQPWKEAAYSQYQRKVAGVGMAMGRSVRTARYRFTEWTVEGSDFLERELYDHEHDPEENVNLAGQAKYATQVAELARLLRQGVSAHGRVR